MFFLSNSGLYTSTYYAAHWATELNTSIHCENQGCVVVVMASLVGGQLAYQQKMDMYAIPVLIDISTHSKWKNLKHVENWLTVQEFPSL